MVILPLLLVVLTTLTVEGVPQRNSPRRGLDGHEFVELLPDDFTKEEYDILLDEFVEFLERKEKIARGDFVDVDNILWRMLSNVTSITSVTLTAN